MRSDDSTAAAAEASFLLFVFASFETNERLRGGRESRSKGHLIVRLTRDMSFFKTFKTYVKLG